MTAVAMPLRQGTDEWLEARRSLITANHGEYDPLYHRAYYLAHRVKALAYEAARVAERREAKRRYDLAYRAGWYAAHREEQQERVRRRRAAKRANGIHVVRERDWLRLVARYDGRCAYCGVRPSRIVRDHVMPISRGGQHAIGNLLPACGSCNSRKHAFTLIEWRARQKQAA